MWIWVLWVYFENRIDFCARSAQNAVCLFIGVKKSLIMTKGTAEVSLSFQLFCSSSSPVLFPQGDPGLPGGVGPAGPKGDKVLKNHDFEKYVCVLLFVCFFLKKNILARIASHWDAVFSLQSPSASPVDDSKSYIMQKYWFNHREHYHWVTVICLLE